MWENCFDNCLGNEFLGITHKTQTTKLSKDEWEAFHHKKQSFCTTKEKKNQQSEETIYGMGGNYCNLSLIHI